MTKCHNWQDQYFPKLYSVPDWMIIRWIKREKLFFCGPVRGSPQLSSFTSTIIPIIRGREGVEKMMTNIITFDHGAKNRHLPLIMKTPERSRTSRIGHFLALWPRPLTWKVIKWWCYHKRGEGGGRRVIGIIIDVNDDNCGLPLRQCLIFVTIYKGYTRIYKVFTDPTPAITPNIYAK